MLAGLNDLKKRTKAYTENTLHRNYLEKSSAKSARSMKNASKEYFTSHKASSFAYPAGVLHYAMIILSAKNYSREVIFHLFSRLRFKMAGGRHLWQLT